MEGEEEGERVKEEGVRGGEGMGKASEEEERGREGGIGPGRGAPVVVEMWLVEGWKGG